MEPIWRWRRQRLWPSTPRLEGRDMEKAKQERQALWGALEELK